MGCSCFIILFALTISLAATPSLFTSKMNVLTPLAFVQQSSSISQSSNRLFRLQHVTIIVVVFAVPDRAKKLNCAYLRDKKLNFEHQR
jgi:hypothetical protein